MSTEPRSSRTPVGITMGCPASIGPEIVCKRHVAGANQDGPATVVIGDPGVLNETAAALGLELEIVPWRPGDEIDPARLNVYAGSNLPPGTVVPGRPTPATGRAMASYLETAVELCLNGTLRGIATCAISKASFNEAGYRFPGHTEFLADRTDAGRVAMMMAGPRLCVVLATIHCPFVEVTARLSTEHLVSLIELADDSLKRDFGIDSPRLGVAGLNPHGGEQGMFGNEERLIIAPAVERARAASIDAAGPLPPDTVFYQAAGGAFDAVVCMYHDQGLIPFKLLHFADGVNVTLGLPIVRTSVDHGTAYDIAGAGTADHRSLAAAVDMAALIAGNRSARGRSAGDRRPKSAS